MVDPQSRAQLRNTVYLKRFFLYLSGRYGRFSGVVDQSKMGHRSISSGNDILGPIRDIIVSTVAATGTEKKKH